ncbi:hypothetical protein GEMRC1_014023 [Eukaryota sp. GEM-RC1]
MSSAMCETSSGDHMLEIVQPTFDKIVKPIPVYPIKVREDGIWALQELMGSCSPQCYLKKISRSSEPEITCAIANPLDSSPSNCLQMFPQYSKFSIEQNEILMNSFSENQRPDVFHIELIAERTRLTVKQVRVWHQNRCNRFKKSMKHTSH